MKIFKYGKFILGLLLITFPYSVYADTASITVACNSTNVKPGDTVTCALSGVTDTTITELEIKSTLSNQLEYISFRRTDDEWQGDGKDGFITLYREEEVTGTFQIGEVNIKVKDNASEGQATLEFNNIEFSMGSKIVTAANSTTTFTISNDASTTTGGLRSLEPTVGNFGQFISTKTSYMLTLPANATTFGFRAVAENVDDEITFYATENRTPVMDPSNITFTTDSGKTQMLVFIEVGGVTYTIGVQKDVATGGSNELSSLTVGDQTVTLFSGVYDDYTVILNDVTNYDVVADLKDRENFQITNLDNLSPRSGEGEFSIIIDPKDNSSGLVGVTYKINVIKSGDGTLPPSSSSKKSSSSKSTPPGDNPQTGGVASIIMALVLILSFGISIYYYKKNISYLTK